MIYKIEIVDPRLWKKDCARLVRSQLERIMSKVSELKDVPWAQHIQVKELHHYQISDFRLRVGEYRVLFDKDDTKKVISLFRVLHRSKLY